MASQNYTIYNFSPSTLYINSLTFTSDGNTPHVADLTGLGGPFGAGYTGSETMTKETAVYTAHNSILTKDYKAHAIDYTKTYVSHVEPLTKTYSDHATVETAVASSATFQTGQYYLIVDNTNNILPGYVASSVNYTSGQTVVAVTSATWLRMNAAPTPASYNVNGETVTFTPNVEWLILNNTTGLDVGWVLSSTGYTGGQTITQVTSGTWVNVSAAPNSTPGPSESITFTPPKAYIRVSPNTNNLYPGMIIQSTAYSSGQQIDEITSSTWIAATAYPTTTPSPSETLNFLAPSEFLILNNTTGILAGYVVSSTNYTSNQTVVSVTSGTWLVISAPPDGTPVFNEDIDFTPPQIFLDVDSTVGILAGYAVQGTGYTSDQQVVSVVSGTRLEMSDYPDSTPSGTLTFFDDTPAATIPPLSNVTISIDHPSYVSPTLGVYNNYVYITGKIAASLKTLTLTNVVTLTAIPVTSDQYQEQTNTGYFDPSQNISGGDGPSGGTGSCPDGSAPGPDGQCSAECFVPETEILLADGSKKKIIDIALGDIVKGKTRNNKVLALCQFVVGDNLLHGFNDITPFVTSCHPIFTSQGWSAFNSKSLKEKWPTDYNIIAQENNGPVFDISDESEILFYQNEFKFKKIKNQTVQKVSKDFKVYNLILDGDHTFVANNVLVHNKCFEAGTKVLMADRTVKKIEDVQVGELVLGADNSSNVVEMFHRPTLGLMNKLCREFGLEDVRITVINKTNLRFSEDHMFMTTEGWKAPNLAKANLIHKKMLDRDKIILGELQVGDLLISDTGNTILVETIDFYDDSPELQLYNFKLSGNKTYYVEIENGKFALVHNKKVICTELYKQGYLDKSSFMLDQRYGEWLAKHDPVAYAGYFKWADPLVSAMRGDLLKCRLGRLMFWKTKEQQEEWTRKWTRKIAIAIALALGKPFAHELARRMEPEKYKFKLTGYLLVELGWPLCRVIGNMINFFQKKQEVFK